MGEPPPPHTNTHIHTTHTSSCKYVTCVCFSGQCGWTMTRVHSRSDHKHRGHFICQISDQQYHQSLKWVITTWCTAYLTTVYSTVTSCWLIYDINLTHTTKRVFTDKLWSMGIFQSANWFNQQLILIRVKSSAMTDRYLSFSNKSAREVRLNQWVDRHKIHQQLFWSCF